MSGLGCGYLSHFFTYMRIICTIFVDFLAVIDTLPVCKLIFRPNRFGFLPVSSGSKSGFLLFVFGSLLYFRMQKDTMTCSDFTSQRNNFQENAF